MTNMSDVDVACIIYFNPCMSTGEKQRGKRSHKHVGSTF